MINDVSMAFGGWLETVTGTRVSGGYVNGRWTEGVPAPISFKGVVQNATEKDLRVLPEGNRDTEAIKIHTQFELIVETQTNTGDIISYDGENWLVKSVADRKIGNYYKALLVKQ